ncbi:hypothetical protein D3C77_671680 [compost metagenome]
MLRTQCQGLIENMPTQGIEQASALDKRKKLRGRQNTQPRMLPSHQSLDAHQLAIEADLGLIVNGPLIFTLRQLSRSDFRQFQL